MPRALLHGLPHLGSETRAGEVHGLALYQPRTQFQRHQFGRPFPHALGDVVAIDDQILPLIVAAIDDDVDVRMAGVEMIDGNPVELSAEVRFHLLHQVTREGTHILHLLGILRRDDEAELMPVVMPAFEEGISIGAIGFRGLKYKVPKKDILITAAAFRIDEDHYLISDLVHTGFSSDAGRVRSQGFEVSANANVTRDLRLIASYTYTDIRFAKTNETAQRVDVYGNSYGAAVSETGKVVPQVPRNMFSIFADYTIPSSVVKGLGVNWGMRYVGYSYVDNVESFKTPPYVLFDIGAHYDFGQSIPALKGLKAQLAVSNLTNKYYLTSCDGSFCYTGQGRRLYGNLTYNW